MSAKEKHRFEEMAEKDKGRYDREMANFDKSGAGGKGGKRKRPKDPNAPKRALLVPISHVLHGRNLYVIIYVCYCGLHPLQPLVM